MIETKHHVVVIGDVMLDRWRLHGPSRPNPEAPHTLTAPFREMREALGGAMNVAKNLAVFPDLEVKFLDVAYRGEVDHRHLTRLAGAVLYEGLCSMDLRKIITPLTTKTRHVVDDAVVFREDDDHHPQVTLGATDVVQSLHDLNPAAIVLTDYGKGALWPPTLTLAILEDVKTWDEIPDVILDFKPRLHQVLASFPDLGGRHVTVKANISEAREAFGRTTGGGVHALGWRAQARAGLAVITHAAQGVQYNFTENDQWLNAPLPKAKTRPRSVCGAGDVFTAVLTHELLGTRGIDHAVRAAMNAATGMVYTRGDGAVSTLVLDDVQRLEDPFLERAGA